MNLRFHGFSNPSENREGPWRCLWYLRFEMDDFGQSEHTDKSRIYLVRRERISYCNGDQLHNGNIGSCEWNIFDMKIYVTWLSPINVNVSAARKLGLHCSAFKHLFCVFGDKATAYRADVYRFLGIPSCLDIEVDLLSSWSTEPTLRHATNFRYRIGDLGERILPRYGNPTSRNRKESHHFWRRDGRAVIDGLPILP